MFIHFLTIKRNKDFKYEQKNQDKIVNFNELRDLVEYTSLI